MEEGFLNLILKNIFALCLLGYYGNIWIMQGKLALFKDLHSYCLCFLLINIAMNFVCLISLFSMLFLMILGSSWFPLA